MSQYTVLFDANVLYPAPMRDALMQLAVTDLFKAKWTADIHREWIDALLRNEPHRDRAALERTRDLMDRATRDCLVTGEALVPAHILERLIATVTEAAAAPAHSAEAKKRLQTAAILAVAINMPPRTGGMAARALGRDLVRLPSGCWRLDWRQQKMLARADAVPLWPEVGLILDDLILAGHPDRLVHLRYEMLAGRNWLTHEVEPPGHRLPSDRVRAAIGVPLHDLRTVDRRAIRTPFRV